MDLLYFNEHTACNNYVTDLKVGFKYAEVPAGGIIESNDKMENHLLFLLKGSVTISCNEFKCHTFNCGEMIFMPKSADCKGEALEDISVIVLIYDNQVSFCDKTSLEQLVPYCENVTYNFDSLPICAPLHSFLILLKGYLQNGINCKHLHEIKQAELFLLFRAYYTKEDNARFFYPIIGKSVDFRGKVMKNYLVAKNAKELALLCGYSISAFSAKFNNEFGVPPYTWMQKQIARHVKGRLMQNEMPFKTIAEEFHFSSQEHLTKFCKAYLGGTPTQIRQNYSPINQ